MRNPFNILLYLLKNDETSETFANDMPARINCSAFFALQCRNRTHVTHGECCSVQNKIGQCHNMTPCTTLTTPSALMSHLPVTTSAYSVSYKAKHTLCIMHFFHKIIIMIWISYNLFSHYFYTTL